MTARLCTFTLCTIPDVETALKELHRVLKPGGRFHYLEHGLAPDASVERWQRRIEPMQKRLADGCHLTRDPTQLVQDAGFEIDELREPLRERTEALGLLHRGRRDRKPSEDAAASTI